MCVLAGSDHSGALTGGYQLFEFNLPFRIMYVFASRHAVGYRGKSIDFGVRILMPPVV